MHEMVVLEVFHSSLMKKPYSDKSRPFFRQQALIHIWPAQYSIERKNLEDD